MATLNLEVNPAIPFPSQDVQIDVEFERYLRWVGEYGFNLIPYAELPERVSLRGTENYVNWLHQLTDLDPQKRERGAFIHLSLGTPTLIYPEDPAIGFQIKGSELEVDFEELPATHLRILEDYFPAVPAHSHPKTSTFSPQDLKTILAEFNVGSLSMGFLASIVGTPSFNYLLLRTADTLSVPREEIKDEMNGYTNQAASLVREEAKELGINASVLNNKEKGQGDRFIDKVMDAVRQAYYGSMYATYFYPLQITKSCADKYQLGFYRSKKDGNYEMVTDDFVRDEQAKYSQALTPILNEFDVPFA